MTDEEKEKLNNTINELCEVLGFTTPLNIIKVAATTTDLFYGLQKENKELEKQLECYKALESHYEEIEEDAKAIAKENEELKAQIEKMKCCGNCINRGLNKDDFSYPCCDCKYWRKIKKNDYWELAE